MSTAERGDWSELADADTMWSVDDDERPSDEGPSTGAGPAAGGGVARTVVRALEVLRTFRGDDDLWVTEVARRVGLSVTTTHRLLRALVEGGVLDQDEQTSRYRLSGSLAEYGQIAYRNHRIHLVEPYLEQLATATGATSSIAVRHGSDAVAIGFSTWREADGHQLQGIRIPLHASALGKALIAWSPITDAELHRLPLTAETERTITSAKELRADLTRSIERGYALNDQEVDVGFRTIGVPVLGDDGSARFAIGVRGPVELMTPDAIDGFARRAISIADEVRGVLFDPVAPDEPPSPGEQR